MPLPSRRRRRAAFLVLVACFLPSLLRPESAQALQVLHHDIKAALSPAARGLHGQDVVTLRLEKDKAVEMELHPAARVLSVSADRRSLRHSFKDGLLRVETPRSDGLMDLRVEYRIVYPQDPPKQPLSADDPSYGVLGVVSEQGVFLPASAGWTPILPGRAPFRLTVTVPEGWLAVSEGRLIGHVTAGAVTTSSFESLQPLEGPSLAAGRYERRETTEGGATVETYLFPDSAALADGLLRTAASAVAFFSELHGPYAFPKFAVVENFFPTGYGFPSFTLLGSQVLRLPFVVAASLPHEVAHCWWGNGVLVDWSKGNWCEGLTSYVADYLARERESAEAGRDYRLQALRSFAALAGGEEDFPLARFRSRHGGASQAVGYGKAMMVFHMARRLAGEEAFWGGLRDVYRDKLFQEATWSDFGRAFGARSGLDFGPFLEQWVERAGAPDLSLTDVAVRPAERAEGESGPPRVGFETVGVIRQAGPVYDLTLPVTVRTDQGVTETLVACRAEATPFSIFTEGRPARLAADPDAHVFRRLSPREIPPAVNSLRGSASLTIVAADSLSPQTLKTAVLLPKTFGQDDVPILTESEAAPAALAGRDLLFLGAPTRPDLIALLPEGGVQIRPDGFSADGRDYAQPGDALFLAGRRGDDRDRVAGLYLPLSAEAAEISLRKIQHYGRYGLLTFRQGVIDLKRTADVPSALEADLP